ncbi:MAG: hypothetical protein MUF60_02475, partial [Vicinamibacterales bacterium]|nr:hypothetical protein [Vicinamibacterales bacterium]
MDGVISAISSRKSEPRCASSKQPRRRSIAPVKALRRRLREHGTFGRLVGHSPAIRRIYRTIEQAAPT